MQTHTPQTAAPHPLSARQDQASPRRLTASLAVLLTLMTVATFALLLTNTATTPAHAQAGHSDPTNDFLQRAVTRDGLVDYDWAKTQRATLDAIVKLHAETRDFKNDQEKLAFYINAYNIITISEVVKNSPEAPEKIGSVLKVDGFFDKKTHRVDGRTVTLNDIENKLIRPLNEPRIHAALVCAAVSCPPLYRGAFQADVLDKQLDSVTYRWINTPAKNTASNGKLALSQIFNWYGEDFTELTHGKSRGIAAFVAKYAEPGSAIANLIKKNPNPEVTFQEYDWALNIKPIR